MSSFSSFRMPDGSHHAAHSFASQGPASRSPPGSQDAASADQSMDEDESDDGYYAPDREQKWTEREDKAFCSSFKRHGRNWAAIATDIEAVEGRQRSNHSMKAKFYRLRRRGLIQAEARGSAQSASRHQGAGHHQAGRVRAPTSSAPRPRTPAKARSFGSRQRMLAGHQWTSEEKAFLQRVGDKHHNGNTMSKERAIHADWMRRYPTSTLTPHVVTAYYHYLRTKEARAQARLEGTASTSVLALNGSLATPYTPQVSRSQQGASRTQRRQRQSSAAYEERRLIGASFTWSRKEIDCLKQAKRTNRVGKPDWNSAKLVFEVFRRLLPDTDRTHNAVHQKLLAMYDHAYQTREEEDEDESEGSSGESGSDEGSEEEQQEQDDYATLSTPLLAGLTSQQRSASSHHYRSLPSGKHAASLHQAHDQHGSFSTSTRSQSSPAPSLNMLINLTDGGIDFENVPPQHGIAVYSPVSFRLLGPAEVETLARALNHFDPDEELQQDAEQMPAFAFQVLEGGALRMLNAPAGTTTTMGIVRGSGAAAEGGGRAAGSERMGIESRVVGLDAFTLRLLTWM